MSNTLRIYWRDFSTGEVGLEGGYQSVKYVPVYEWAELAAEKYRKSLGNDGLGVKVETDGSEGFYVMKMDRHRVGGRYYFIASLPVYVPLGDGWARKENPGGEPGQDIVFGFSHNGRRVTLTWKAMTEDEIDALHGNDEFGGWNNPSIVMHDGEAIPLEIALGDKPGEADAVTLMMHDKPAVMAWLNDNS